MSVDRKVPTMHYLARTASMLILFLFLFAEPTHSIPWPYDPGDVPYDLGNNYGEYQYYEDQIPYYHDGLDILAGTPRKVYAVSDGTVTHVTNDGGLYSGVVIGEPVAGGTGYLYWHLDSSSITVEVGVVVKAGDTLGTVVSWPVPGFHHIHFCKVRGTGGYPWIGVEVIGNPLADLNPNVEATAPVIEKAAKSTLFLFCKDESSKYVDSNHINGSVDIISKIHDTFNGGNRHLVPYSIDVEIRSLTGTTLGKWRSIEFSGPLGKRTALNPLYKRDGVALSQGNYKARAFYFVLTNTDGAGHVSGGMGRAWNTSALAPGIYDIMVTASNLSGRSVQATMRVRVEGG